MPPSPSSALILESPSKPFVRWISLSEDDLQSTSEQLIGPHLRSFSASIIKQFNWVNFYFFAWCFDCITEICRSPVEINFLIVTSSFTFHLELHWWEAKKVFFINFRWKRKTKNVIPFIDNFLTIFSFALLKSMNERFTTMWSIESCSESLRNVSHESKLDAAASTVLWLFLVSRFSLEFPFWQLLMVVTSIAVEKNKSLNRFLRVNCR